MLTSELYLKVRAKEGRIYPDEVAARLPDISASHPLAFEWRARAASSSRLVRYLSALGRPLAILEVGCGNGWLANQLAQLSTVNIWGLDRFSSELAQAGRVFQRANLAFLAVDIFTAPFPTQIFDTIVLASVIQYFPDLAVLIRALWPLLKPGGEIHLLDSPLYLDSEIPAARQRTNAYYTALGFPEMAGHYHHHSTAALEAFSPRWLYRPNGINARLRRWVGQSVSPFPWVVIPKTR
jgi:ubiquinone/menaquinone biosynthesis C-methylase UbiE